MQTIAEYKKLRANIQRLSQHNVFMHETKSFH